jgi:hypothetical protein
MRSRIQGKRCTRPPVNARDCSSSSSKQGAQLGGWAGD